LGCENEVAAVCSDKVLGGLFDVAVSRGEWVEVLLVVAESYFPRSWSPTVESVGRGEFVSPPLSSPDDGGSPGPTRGEPAPTPPPPIPMPTAPPVRSEFWRLVVEKFMLPASPVSRGCRILLSRTCCKRSASRLWSWSPPRPRMRDFRRFSGESGGEEGLTSFVDVEVEGLRLDPMPSKRNILRFKPPSGRRGMRFVSGVSLSTKRGSREKRRKGKARDSIPWTAQEGSARAMTDY